MYGSVQNSVHMKSHRTRKLLTVIFFVATVVLSCVVIHTQIDDDVQISSLESMDFDEVKTVKVFPHDENAFTEGLLFHGKIAPENLETLGLIALSLNLADGYLYESTGINGKSSLRKVPMGIFSSPFVCSFRYVTGQS